MIVLAARLMGHFLAVKSYFQCTKKMVKDNSLSAKVGYFKF